MYLENRAAKGFNVIQAVALSECDGVGTPNSYGHLPLIDRNPAKPATVEGEALDWVLVLDDATKRYAKPGKITTRY